MTSATTNAQQPKKDLAEPPANREVSNLALVALAVVVGGVAGIGAVFFKHLIALISNLAFYGKISIAFDPNAYGPPSVWGPWVILVPVIGGLGVVWLVRTFAPEAKGHGVPEVMFAIFHKGGNIRGMVAVIKSLASALSIGTGASVGREGPIIQIGASFGSTFGRWLRLERPQKIVLLAAGAGAGIAATFNTPVGGLLFAVELLLPEISTASFLPVITATVTSTYISRIAVGSEAAFSLPLFEQLPMSHPVTIEGIAIGLVTGVAIGIASYTFIRLLATLEDVFDNSSLNPYLQNVIGMSAVGVLGYLFYLTIGHYHVYSVGYSTIQDILYGHLSVAAMLFVLFLAKLVATCISLASGASGGIFSPCLFMGATLGAAIAAAGNWLFPDAGFSIVLNAIIGMGAMVGASTTAAATAIVMILEMTRDYNVVLPLVMAVATALGIRRSLISNDIYTIKLRNRGVPIPTERSTNMLLIQPARSIMSEQFIILPETTLVSDALEQVNAEINRVLVADGQRVVGYVRFAKVPHLADRNTKETLSDIMKTDYVISTPAASLNSVLTRMTRRNRSFAIVFSEDAHAVPRVDDVLGIIDNDELARAVRENHYA